ncbi:MAG TPA: histidine phosphatase family protein [Dermatophilaceae bacterium]|nr:histidine phosphatase family protein [Dermatophilaceae bacterium]
MRAGRRVVVLRHGETTHNAAGIWQGHLDSPLSERGLAQAEVAGRALSALGPTAVVASDLARAARTADAVGAACGIPVSYDARFREIHAGEWQGMSGAQVREQYPEDMDRLLRGEDFRRGGTGESVADVAGRCREAVEEVLGELGAGECVVVATHGVSGRALVASLVGIDQQLAWVVLSGLGNACWAELEEGRLGWRIRTWNDSARGAGGVSTSLA